MIEAEAKEVLEDDAVEAFKLVVEEIEKINAFQNQIIAELGHPKTVMELPEASPELREVFDREIVPRLREALYVSDKHLWVQGIDTLKHEWFALAETSIPGTSKQLMDEMYEHAMDEIVHENIINPAAGEERRPDGRGTREVRPLFATAHITERNHGSAIFFRGQTHILSVVTLGAPGDTLLIEGMEVREKRHFIHHYNFPPFSVGETGPMRGPGRREIGHGALAEKALRAVVPTQDIFPYTIRIVSETLSSNGSSSMGSVCGSTLAMLDAGVPITAPVAGISMGVMMRIEPNNTIKYKVLTDIQGPEDHHGDMDFKAAGTRAGLTAIQMDVKVEGVTLEILREALGQAKEARLQILDVMEAVLKEPRKELSPYAPRIITLKINPLKIRDVIGPGGKVINEIIEETGAQIDIEQDGTIFITGLDQESAEKARVIIDNLTHEYEVGETFTGTVSRLFNFGAMVEIAPHQEGLVHISELAQFRVEKVTDIVDVGDVVPVKIIGIDDQGRINLSIKEVATLEPKNGKFPGEHHKDQGDKHNPHKKHFR